MCHFHVVYWKSSWPNQLVAVEASTIDCASIIFALDADTGKIVWHYQTTPYDTWDYDGVNQLVLADLDINGQKTPVGLKADCNGFFYVLNRQNGALISAQPFVLVSQRPNLLAAQSFDACRTTPASRAHAHVSTCRRIPDRSRRECATGP
jgi:glucose dehydrogenase